MLDILGDNVLKLRRSNRIFHKERFVKYPFENDLAALSETDKQYCLTSFLQNPYSQYSPQNMLQFFLATFGEGITNLFLRPYNEKIWKFDPAFIDTQMVGRIPKPPAEDIIKSANGIPTEGYVHQLYFYYPKTGGIESLIKAMQNKLGRNVHIHLNADIVKVEKSSAQWTVSTSDGAGGVYDRIVSTIPIQALIKALGAAVPQEVTDASRELKYNSIAICVIRVNNHNLGDNFAITIADKEVLFHRLSKVNFLFPQEDDDGTTTLTAEVTYRNGDMIDQMSDNHIITRVVGDLERLAFIDSRDQVLAHELRRRKYAYVIYDLDHRRNLEIVRDYCRQLGLSLHGRFGEFEYFNMDTIVWRSIDKCREIEELL